MHDVLTTLQAALADRYRIERQLGQGGMATVYLAYDLKHHRQVALKVLRPDLAATLGPDRFMQEIEIAARLQHPHILGVYDSGEAGGFLYYVMPYVEGESLRERLASRGELPIHDAVRLLAEITEALAYAHAHGVVHRDIKPENIMLSGRHALVMDFGVAKAVSEASGRNKLTSAGVAVGTPAYMAPEQASADPHLDQRVDIYALGVLGYELFTGRPPFTGGTPQQVLAAHISMAPEPVSKHRPSVSLALASVIMRALEKRPADRWQTADEMLAQLEPLATPSGGTTPAETRPVSAVPLWRQGRSLMLAGLAVALLMLVALMLWNPAPSIATLGRAIQVTREAGLQELPRVSPDGKSIAYYQWVPGDTSRVFFRRADGGATILLYSRGIPLAWSRGGDHLLIGTDRGLEIIPALGGPSRLLVKTGWPLGTWSPDDRRVAYVRGDSLLVLGEDGRSAPLAHSLEPHSLAWSPDGRWIAFVSGNLAYFRTYNVATSSIWLVAASGGEPIPLTGGETMDQSPVWAPDSRRLLFVSNRDGTRDIYQLDLGRGGHPAGKPIQLTHGLNASMISLTPDGTTLAYSVATAYSNVWSVALPATGWVSSRDARMVTTDRELIENFDISRDGRWLVFDSDRAGKQQLFRRLLAGGDVQQVTRDTVAAFDPSLSPDGSEVAYHTITHGLRRVLVTATDGTGIPFQVSPGTFPDERAPRWSPDGERIVWWWARSSSDTGSLAFITRRGSTWGPPQVPSPVEPGETIWRVWLDSISLAGSDSAGHIIAFPVTPSANQRIITPPGFDDRNIVGPTARLADDGRSIIAPYVLSENGVYQTGIYLIGSGWVREILRFDDPGHPHRPETDGIALKDGRLYFTLQSPESSVWTVPIAGLAR